MDHSPCGHKESDTTEVTEHAGMQETISVLDLGGFCVWAQLHPTLDGSMDCSPPDPSACGIFQARMLEWDAISYSRGSSHP